MHYIYVSGAIPEELNDSLGYSVAGNKFSINMARAIDDESKGNLTFVSTASLPPNVDATSLEIWQGKPMLFAKRGKGFLVNELILRRNIKKLLLDIIRKHPGEAISLIVENSPFASSTAAVSLKKRFGLKLYSITIDTPFTKAFSSKGLAGRINKMLFACGINSLKKFDGIVSFTEDVKNDLQIDIPFCPFLIGCEENDVSESAPSVTDGRSAAYAGTLIYYNGICELVEAYALLGDEYKLDIYGYGPLEDFVKEASKKYSNISFKGRFSPAETKKVLSSYDLLINPRIIDPTIENYTFPSKLIDYILTGKSVLTSKFKTLPEEYEKFVYYIDSFEPCDFADSIKRVYEDSVDERNGRAKAGIDYLGQNQTYKAQIKNIIEFIKE